MARSFDALTEKEEAFVNAMLKGKSQRAASMEAGYADPDGEADRLLGRAKVRDRLIYLLQKQAVSYEVLRVKMLRKLDFLLSDDHKETCLINHPENLREEDTPHCSCGYSKIKPSDVNAAIKNVAWLLGKADPKLLKDRAVEADKAETTDEAVDRILGEPPGPTDIRN